MGWTDERVELLKKLWADGLSAAQIAAELGGITRNAVIGKVHRLGLSGRAKSTLGTPRKPRSRSSTAKANVGRIRVLRGNTALQLAIEQAAAEGTLEDNIIPLNQRRTLLQL